MPIDDRLREGLQRSMSAIDADPERRLEDARRRGGRLVLIRRVTAAIAVAVAVVIVAVAGPRALDLSRGQRPQPAAPPSFTPLATAPILGTWRVEYTCRKIVRAFEDAGIPTFAAQKVVTLGLEPGPAHQLASSTDPCAGAKRITRTVTFNPDGYLRRIQEGRVVDDCRCYRLIGSNVLVSPGDFRAPNITLRYQLAADLLSFEAVRPGPCSSPVCQQALATAVGQYAVGTWHRLN